MPLALDPECTFKHVLTHDKKKPEGEQPYFVFHYLSDKDWKFAAKVSETIDDLGPDAALKEREDAIRLGLVGWGNMFDRKGGEIPYDPDRLEEIINPVEMWELLVALMTRTIPGAEDLKKSESPSPSSTDKSAEKSDVHAAAKKEEERAPAVDF